MATRLQNFNVEGTTVNFGCLLSANVASNAPCVYAYSVAGVSAFASLAISLILCCTCDLCGCGAWLDAAFEGAAAAWWGVAAGVLAKNAAAADAAGVARPEWRERLLWASYGTCAAFAACALVSVARGLAKCCGG